jgi:hypothetical protein
MDSSVKPSASRSLIQVTGNEANRQGNITGAKSDPRRADILIAK